NNSNAAAAGTQLLAARGYVVLVPSMPWPLRGTISDPFLEVTKGVLPAIDKVIEIGLADANRLGVIGQSAGGFASYVLIEETNRFKAAVSISGISNWISLYGAFDARDRYTTDPETQWFMPSQLEAGLSFG